MANFQKALLGVGTAVVVAGMVFYPRIVVVGLGLLFVGGVLWALRHFGPTSEGKKGGDAGTVQEWIRAPIRRRRIPASPAGIEMPYKRRFLHIDQNNADLLQILVDEIFEDLLECEPKVVGISKRGVIVLQLELQGRRAPGIVHPAPVYLCVVGLRSLNEFGRDLLIAERVRERLREHLREHQLEALHQDTTLQQDPSELDDELDRLVGAIRFHFEQVENLGPNEIEIAYRLLHTSDFVNFMLAVRPDADARMFVVRPPDHEEDKNIVYDIIQDETQRLFVAQGCQVVVARGGFKAADIHVPDAAGHGTYHIENAQLTRPGLTEPDLANKRAGVVVYPIDPPIPVEEGRISGAKGRIRLHGLVDGEELTRFENESFINMRALRPNVIALRADVRIVSIFQALGVEGTDISPRFLVFDHPVQEGEKWADARGALSPAGNFAIHYRKNQAEGGRLRWFLQPLGGSQVRFLSRAEASRFSEASIDRYSPLEDRRLLPAEEMYIATRANEDGKWLVFYVESGTEKAPQSDLDSHQRVGAHTDSELALVAVRRYLRGQGVRSIEMGADVASGEALVRRVTGELHGRPLTIYAKVPDGRHRDRYHAVLDQLAEATVVLRTASLDDVCRGSADVLLERIGKDGVRDPNGRFVLVLSPEYQVFDESGELEEWQSRVREIHGLVEQAFSARLLVSDLQPRNVGFEPHSGRIQIFDHGAFVRLPLETLEVPRKEGIYRVPELDGVEKVEEAADVDVEALQVWFEGLLFYQLVMGNGRYPEIISAIGDGGEEDFALALEKDIREVPHDDERELLRRMLAWRPVDRPSLAEVGEALAEQGRER